MTSLAFGSLRAFTDAVNACYQSSQRSTARQPPEVIAGLIKPLRNVRLFAGLSDEQLEVVADLMVLRPIQPAEVLYCAGDAPDEVYVVASGVLEEKSGGTIVFSIKTGGVAGARALLGEPRARTLRASKRAMVLSFSAAEALSVMEADPRLAAAVYRNLASYELGRADAVVKP